MLRRYAPILLILLLLLSFVLVAQAIVSVNLLELRVQISQDRILNYELSSRVLRARFRQLLEQGDDAYRDEIRRNVLEASIMNATDPRAFEMRPVEYVGLGVINGVRALSLKRPLRLREDQDVLLLMRYAFFMERNRRYSQAAEKYAELEQELGDASSEALGFVLLHQGYCLAIAGDPEQALEKLYRVRDLFAGTHYAETANVLINLLLEGQRRSDAIAGADLSDRERARALFRAGQYAAAVTAFQDLESLSDMDRYMLARSLEETGQVPTAIQGYLEVVRTGTDLVAVRAANRRLLLIGSFYGGGQQLTNYATEQAQNLGDEAVVEEVREAAELQREAIVIDELRAAAREGGDEAAATLAEELQAEIVLSEPVGSAAIERPEVPVPSAALDGAAVRAMPGQALARLGGDISTLRESMQPSLPERPSSRLYPRGRFVIVLNDGRELRGERAVISGESISVESGPVPTRLPRPVVRQIRADPATLPPGLSQPLDITLSNGERLQADAVQFEAAVMVLVQAGAERRVAASQLQEIAIP
ncbi:MAG: hypothetical protein H7A21_13065 [Spirochaetales bacterium]|nr:hypothetical protein [Leptospiraceae bacterium]MCP5482359.1 hypothetical protein [Spirochaetales bacterium]MCP5484202.1 hypothetical protein [Spirochaetales bacterium]